MNVVNCDLFFDLLYILFIPINIEFYPFSMVRVLSIFIYRTGAVSHEVKFRLG